MGKMRIVALGGAVACAVLAATMARNLVGRKPDTVSVSTPVKTETTQIIVATKDISLGDKLGGAIAWQDWPKDRLADSMITKQAKPKAEEDLAEARASIPMFKDEPVNEKKYVLPGAGGFMGAFLPKGMRAKAVAISSRSSAGGFILPNDRVDVIVTKKLTSPNGPVFITDTVLTNVRVLAVNQVFKKPATGNDLQSVDKSETATLELTPEQIEVLSVVEASGELSLALRSIAENDGKSADEIKPELAGRFGKNAKKPNGGDPIFIMNGVESYPTPH